MESASLRFMILTQALEWKRRVGGLAARLRFRNSAEYWESRYKSGGDSGAGSRSSLAQFKADFLNDFFSRHGIESAVEFGCGDGQQAELFRFPRYTGYDVSSSAVRLFRARLHGRSAYRAEVLNDYDGTLAEVALSLDVIYHLVEDSVFEAYMMRLFDAATRYVIIYSSDRDDARARQTPHVRHRAFSQWVAAHRPDWRLVSTIPNRHPYDGHEERGSFADFFVYERVASP